MKNILEALEDVQSLSDFINDQKELQIDESLRDIIQALKKRFKQVWDYLHGLVVKLTGSYWCPIDDDGNVMNAISPLTAGQAYKDGAINKNSTLVVMDSKAKKITGCNTKAKDAIKLYGSGNSIKYWERAIHECEQISGKTINEVKLHTEDSQAKYNVLDTPELMEEIKFCFTNKNFARLLIWGAPGIGKTAILMNVLKSLPNGDKMNLVVKTLSNETPDNFTLPKYVEINGQEKATDVPKTWLPVYKPTGDADKDQILDDACGKGLLFIDELSRATPQVLNVILPIINEGIFNGYKLGSGWVIIVASNRAEDEMSGQSDIGNALGNRFRQVYYEPTAKSWMQWAKTQNYMSPLLLSWLSMGEDNMSGAKYFYMDPNETMEGAGVTKIMCTPRSWTNAMRQLAVYSHTGNLEGFTIFDIPRHILARTLNQYVPAEAVDAFLAFLEVVSKVGDFDATIKDVWRNSGKNFKISRKDLHLVALPLAQLIVTSHNDSFPTEKEFTSLCEWLVAQNSDQLTSYVLDILQNVYAYMLPENTRPGIFVIREKIDKELKNDPVKLKMYAAAFKAFTDKWNLNFEDIPNWRPGQLLLAKKFGEAFSRQIEGVDALG